MNSNTGQIFSLDDETAKELNLVPWSVGERVEIKGCYFRVHTINSKRSRVTLKGISKAEFTAGA